MIRKVEMERLTVISTRPFDDVVAATRSSVGNPDMAAFGKAVKDAESSAGLDATVRPDLGPTGLMPFVEFDHGMVVRKGTEHRAAKIVRPLIGKPLIIKEMAKHVPDAWGVFRAAANSVQRSSARA
jgi:hypothetical protein